MIRLTEQQTNELVNIKHRFPYRIIFGVVDKVTGIFTVSAVTTMRVPNKLSREGHYVVVLR